MAASTSQARTTPPQRRPRNGAEPSLKALYLQGLIDLHLPLKGLIVGCRAALSNKELPQSTCLLAGMTMKEFHVPAGLSVARAAFTAALLGFAAPAFAQQPPPAPSASFAPNARAQAPAQSATRYEDATSQRSFVLEQRGKEAIVKYEDSPEVMVLEAVSGQRGDTFFRSDAGQVMYRLTEQGNLVSYVDDKDGAPASMAGLAAPLNAPPMTASLNEMRVNAASRLSKLAGHDVTIFGAAEFASHEQWAAEALSAMVRGVERSNGLAGRVASKLNAVRMTSARSASVTFKDGELVLKINPAEGYLGLPSSEAVAQAMTAARSTN
jgi:Domain of unknown function (DUF4908)